MSKEQYQQQQQWGTRGGFSGRTRGRGGGRFLHLKKNTPVFSTYLILFEFHNSCQYSPKLKIQALALCLDEEINLCAIFKFEKELLEGIILNSWESYVTHPHMWPNVIQLLLLLHHHNPPHWLA